MHRIVVTVYTFHALLILVCAGSAGTELLSDTRQVLAVVSILRISWPLIFLQAVVLVDVVATKQNPSEYDKRNTAEHDDNGHTYSLLTTAHPPNAKLQILPVAITYNEEDISASRTRVVWNST